MIVYFSGTGNSRFVAKKLAELTGDELCDATRYTREGKGAEFSKPGSYVFVSPSTCRPRRGPFWFLSASPPSPTTYAPTSS